MFPIRIRVNYAKYLYCHSDLSLLVPASDFCFLLCCSVGPWAFPVFRFTTWTGDCQLTQTHTGLHSHFSRDLPRTPKIQVSPQISSISGTALWSTSVSRDLLSEVQRCQ